MMHVAGVLPGQISEETDVKPSEPTFELRPAQGSKFGRRSKRLAFSLTLALTIALGAAWYWQSPVLALRAFHQAVATGDSADLTELVDFVALREQFRAELVSQTLLDRDRSIARLADLASLDITLSTLGSPAGMQRALQDAGFVSGLTARQTQLDNWTIERSGLSRFKARIRNGAVAGPQLVFRRDGLNWRLVGIYAAQERTTVGEAAVPGQHVHDLDPSTVSTVISAEATGEAEAMTNAAIAEAGAGSQEFRESNGRNGAERDGFAATDGVAAPASEADETGNPDSEWSR